MSQSIFKFLAYLVVIAAGVSVALQQVLNARLRVELGSPWWAAFTSYFVGMLVMLVAVIAVGASPVPGATLARVSWSSWTGGLFGAIFIGIAILMVPRLGAATVLALLVLGQMLGSLAFDQFGVLGLPQHAASPARLVGAALLVLGVVLVRT